MMVRSPLGCAPAWIAAALVIGLTAGCGGGGRRAPAIPGDAPAVASPGPASDSVQGLYESGRFREVLNRVGVGTGGPEALWFAAQSSLRLDQRDEAIRLLTRLPAAGGSTSWQVVSELALARISGDVQAIDRARAASAAFPADPFVQFESGLASVGRNETAEAAQAFDRCAQADPRFAYAYYHAGLAYDRLRRADLMVIRLEMFLRLAPEAPERPEVEAILQTVRR